MPRPRGGRPHPHRGHWLDRPGSPAHAELDRRDRRPGARPGHHRARGHRADPRGDLFPRPRAALLAAALGRLSAAARWGAAVVITAAAFALVHALLLAGTPGEAVLTGVSTFLFALLAGAVAAATQRLGGAIVGHVVFNGLGVLLTWAV
ncbi:CPBP family glutamic-type intramembrane protease [Sinomonas atrocyanea]